ncbi:MAG: hypothetical protein HS111_21080 [Kofleriaceae bacterium]|nr:hypothetical protein [Kofleriaceae bacterium]MCL4223229.1 C-type lectin domain-containing protein [Myxococcales bacterium]
MRPPAILVLVAIAACAKADPAPADDAGAEDAAVDASPCTGQPWAEEIEVTCDGLDNDCDGTTDNVLDPPAWFADRDSDGHGDPASRIEGCDAPADHVALGDDCDDTQPLVHPGAIEVCDGLDNDCTPATTEVCSSGCVVRVRPDDGRRYLFCAIAANQATARGRCTTELFRLARVDDQAENTYLRSTTTSAIGNVNVWLGASDAAVEGAWRWDDGAQFWQGGSGGVPIGGLYENWDSGEPNNSDNEDCGELRTNSLWNDVECSAARAFICERY